MVVTKKNTELFCNACGKKIKIEHGILKEDVFEASKEWGYFSKKDLQFHKFNICEECYENIVATFKIPIEIVNIEEVL